MNKLEPTNQTHVSVRSEPYLVASDTLFAEPYVAIHATGVTVTLCEAAVRKSITTMQRFIEALDRIRRPVEVPEVVPSEVGTQLAADLVKIDAEAA